MTHIKYKSFYKYKIVTAFARLNDVTTECFTFIISVGFISYSARLHIWYSEFQNLPGTILDKLYAC